MLKIFKNPKFDWIYNSEKEDSQAGRGIYLCRGKVLGGSSCTNVLLYHRGEASDYDTWAEMCQDDSWKSQNVLPYFKKSQDDFRGESKYHGIGGEYSTSEVAYQNPLSRTFLTACGESGLTPNDDFNNWSRSQEGYGRFQVFEKNGARSSSASGFLEPVLNRNNLVVSANTLVNKITFEGKTATGVEVEIKGVKTNIQLAEGGEVLLSGGAIASPHILMLSGIGPKEHLEEHQISVVQDIPGVGQNLQDHPAAVVSYACAPGNDGISVTSKIRVKGTTLTNPKVLLQWLLKRKGPLTSTGCDHGGFFRTKTDLKSPDLQVRFLPAQALSADGMNTFTAFRDTKDLPDGFSFQSIASRSHSKGSVLLKSKNPHDHPVIKTSYFSDKRDLETIREGIKLSRKISSSPAFAQYKGAEIYPGPNVQTDEQIEDYIKNTVHTSNALTGTCKMGNDPMSVVSSQLKVHGVNGLRVIDASIMPKIPGGQTGAPTFMLAEKAAAMIISTWKS